MKRSRNARSLTILTVVVLLLASPACASSEGPEPRAAPTDDAEAPLDDARVLRIFSGTDAQAMAALGRRLEGERPPLSTALLDTMLTLLGDEIGDEPELRMLRAMLFRSAAVSIGPRARGTLERCIRTTAVFRQLCEDVKQEIGY